MKKYLLLTVLCLLSSSIKACFNADGSPTASLQKLLAMTNVTHDGTIAGIVKATQKEQPTGWLRKTGQSRWDMPDHYKDQKAELLPYLA